MRKEIDAAGRNAPEQNAPGRLRMEPIAGERLNELLRTAGLAALDPETSCRFDDYLALILRWNTRTNLTSIRDAEGICARHFLESIACARALPAEIATLLDLGSGAGFPGLPVALCRREIAVTLAESQGKKAAFLLEAIRTLDLPVAVHAGRAETLRTRFDCVALRAVDRMPEAISTAAALVNPGGWMALMVTGAELAGLEAAAGREFSWKTAIPLPNSKDRVLALGARKA